jgi:hypothetical protein
LPSTTKIGQIKFDGVSVVSATSARDQGACLVRRNRVFGYPAAVAFAGEAFSTLIGDVFFEFGIGGPSGKWFVCTPERRLTQGQSSPRTKTEHRRPPQKPGDEQSKQASQKTPVL